MSSGTNILVLDDDRAIRDSCWQALSQDETSVEVAADGLTGLAKLEKKDFDIVMLDLKMPGLSGMEVLKRIKEKHPEIAVVVTTGYTNVESVLGGAIRGSYNLILKPFTPDSLRAALKLALEKRKTKQKKNSRKNTKWSVTRPQMQ